MPIDPVAPAAPGGIYSNAPTRAPKQTMDSEVFLTLLVSQLRNQDPSSPMDTNAMISQTTQLAMMEQLTAMSRASDESFALQMRTAAAALVGHEVSYTDADGKDATGTVTSVSYSGSVPTVAIGDIIFPLDAVSGVVTKTKTDTTS